MSSPINRRHHDLVNGDAGNAILRKHSCALVVAGQVFSEMQIRTMIIIYTACGCDYFHNVTSQFELPSSSSELIAVETKINRHPSTACARSCNIDLLCTEDF
jgi:hypothetical protein